MTEAHTLDAVLELETEDDDAIAAPGAAVTAALCGHWEHEGACRWPHRTEVSAHAGRVVDVRIVFDAPEAELPEVRSRISAALDRGEQAGPDGRVHRWVVRRHDVRRQDAAGPSPE